MKKANVVNITLAVSNKQYKSHNLSQDKQINSQQNLQNSIYQKLLNDCLEIIQMIAEQKQTQRQKIRNRSRPSAIKTGAEPEATLPLRLLDSVQIVLKRFVSCKIEEQSRKTPSQSRFLGQKSDNFKFLLFKGKENSQYPLKNQIEDLQFREIFNKNTIQGQIQDKMASKIKELENQLVVYRQKIKEKNGIISKLLNKQILIKKKYISQINKILRSKNICSISQEYEHQTRQKQQDKYILNLAGKTLESWKSPVGENPGKRFHKTQNTHPQSRQSNLRYQCSPVCNNSVQNLFQNTQTIKSFEIESVNQSHFKILPNRLSYQSHKISRDSINKNQNVEVINSGQQICQLKKELQYLLKAKKYALDQLQETNQKVQKQIEKIEENIAIKREEIAKEQQKFEKNTVDINGEQFHELQLNGYFNEQQLFEFDEICQK